MVEETDQDHPLHVRDPRVDIINDAVGSNFYSPNYSERWMIPQLGWIKVNRYYHHQKVAYDMPATVEEKDLKAEFFKGKGIKYIALNPGQAMDGDVFFKWAREILEA